ncbi:unnamed protein product [Effrenium voratum]|uniref:Uncharacterized protein n=1 Tax=Effrenium voratum TaxID=2562239 RepID=A0AA36J2I7_9DINO|nr:unnamed protein product [Effrenium voratum]
MPSLQSRLKSKRVLHLKGVHFSLVKAAAALRSKDDLDDAIDVLEDGHFEEAELLAGEAFPGRAGHRRLGPKTAAFA